MNRTPYNADAQIPETVPREVDIDGTIYKVKRTGKALKRIVAMTPDDESADNPEANISLMYEGLSIILIKEDGQHPTADELEDSLDFEVAQDLMEKFLPRRVEGDSPTPEAVPSTPATDGQG